jgi:hypothetical protein
MKNQVITLIIVFLATVSFVQAQSFGEELSDAKAVKTKTLAKTMEGKETMQVKLEGEINEVCQMKGCWMTVDAVKTQR